MGGSSYVAQAGFKLEMLTASIPESWDYRIEPPCPAQTTIFYQDSSSVSLPKQVSRLEGIQSPELIMVVKSLWCSL